MNFSRHQWLLGFVLDFLLKFGCLYLIGSFTWMGTFLVVILPIALFFSTVHFILLALASKFVRLFDLTATAKRGLAVIVANILFVGGSVAWIWSGEGTACSDGYGKCDRINGAITPSGIQTLAVFALVLFVLNLIPILISAAFGSPASQNQAIAPE